MTVLTNAPALPLEDDRRAWVEGLYRQYSARVFRFMHYRLGSREQAEDLTALTFQRVIENAEHFNPAKGSEAVWLFTLARRVLIDHTRRQRPSVPLDGLEHLPGPSAGPEARAEQSERLAALGRALQKLKPRELAVVSLKYAGELRSAEIAKVLGLSEKNIEVILSRTRQKLRLMLEEDTHEK